MTKILIDSADLELIQKIYSTGIAAGVTTNPSLVASQAHSNLRSDQIDKFTTAYIPLMTKIREIIHRPVGAGPAHLSAEVTTLDPNLMVWQANQIHSKLFVEERYMHQRHVDLFIKIPFGIEYLSVINQLTRREDIHVNATAITTAKQAILASKSGAQIVSFFFNRMRDAGIDAPGEIKKYMKLAGEGRAAIICGSIRKPDDVLECMDLGVEYVTVSPKIIEEMCVSEPTTVAVKKFQEDIDKWLK